MVAILRTYLTQRGFTLVETLVAVVIFTVALLGIAGLTVVIIRGNTFSNMVTTATVLAQDKLEELRQTDYSALGSGSETTIRNAIVYTRRWDVTANTPTTSMTTIAVTITWQVPGKQPRQVVLQTIRSGI